MFIMLTGSSGVGKNTVITKLEKENEKFKLMPTYTTRERRPTEIDGNPYYFLSKEEFQQKIDENELIEYELIHTNYYGSSFKILDDFIKQNKILIKDIGIEGAQNLTAKLKDVTKTCKVFLTTSKSELKKRLIGRGEKNIKLRLQRYGREQSEINKFDFIIYNDDLEQTCKYVDLISGVEIENILPTKLVKKISTRKINKYVKQLENNKVLSPIKIALDNDKLYIIKGHEKFIASVLTHKLVAKLFVDKKVNKTTSENETEWSKLIEASK